MNRHRLQWRLVFLAASSLAIGCGESDTGMVVKRSASERPDIDRPTALKGALAVPAAQPFNFTTFTSGQLGTARGESTAVGKDGARCSAEAGDGGSAWGEFQLGYCFDNTSGEPLDASVKLTYKLTETRSSKGPVLDARGVDSTGKSALRFFIKDTNGRTLKTEDLSTSTLATGPVSQTNKRDMVFDARFEPNRGYYLVLTCRTDAQAAAGANTSVAMNVEQAGLEIAWRTGESKSAATGHERAAPTGSP